MTSPQKQDKGTDDLGRICFYSLLVAAAAMIPVPFLDDAVLGRVEHRQVADVMRRSGQAPDSAVLEALLGTGSRSGWGCIFVTFFYLLVKVPAKFLFKSLRKILVFWAISDATRAASSSLERAVLIQHALRSHVAPGGLDAEAARRVAECVRWARRGTGGGPVRDLLWRSLRGSGRTLRRTAAALVGRRSGAADVADLGSVAERMSDTLAGDQGAYLRRLCARFDDYFLGRAPHPDSGGASDAAEPARGDA